MKRKCRKLLSLTLCLAVLTGTVLCGFEGLTAVISALTLHVNAESLDLKDNNTSGITWDLSDDTLTISGSGNMDNYSSSSSNLSPWHDSSNSIKKVIIEDGIESIGQYAFYNCSNLQSVTIPDGLVLIGGFAFMNCAALTDLEIPESVQAIGGYAFSGCTAITVLEIPENVQAIGDCAFCSCTGLTEINYNARNAVAVSSWNMSESSISSYPFDRAGNEENGIAVKIGDAVETISVNLFKSEYGYNSYVSTVSFGENVTSIGESAFEGCFMLKTVELPDSVTNIENSAFKNCSGLTAVSLGENVVNIGSSAFYGCKGLAEISLPESIEYLGSMAFFNCTDLQNVSFPDKVFVIGSGVLDYTAFWNTHSNWENGCLYVGKNLVSGLGAKSECTVKQGTLTIAAQAFYQNRNIKSVTLPDSLRLIGESALWNSALTAVDFGNGVVNIGASAFSYCDNLGSIIIPDSVKEIGENAFSNCDSASVLQIGKSVETIDDGTFRYCSGFESIDVHQQNSKYYSSGNCLIEKSTKTLIQGCKNSIIPGDGEVEILSAYAFSSCSELTHIDIPYGVKELSGFSGSGLTNIDIPDSVTVIGNSAFSYCELSEEVVIPDSVVKISAYAFYRCSKIPKITIGESVEDISEGAFDGCSKIEEIVIPSSVMSIDSRAFSNCVGLKYLTITENVSRIGGSAFMNCPNIERISVDSRNRNYKSDGNCLIVIDTWDNGNTLMLGCRNSVIPNGITVIEEDAFCNCSELKEIEIPNTVKSIRESAFSGCTGISVIEIPDSVQDIYDNAFYDVKCISYSDQMTAWGSPWGANSVINNTGNEYTEGWLTYKDDTKTEIVSCSTEASGTIEIPATVESIGNAAFMNCKNITSVIIPNSVYSLNDYAFKNCTGLESVTIPGSVGYMGYDVFQNCSGLTSVIIEDGVRSISAGAFINCASLKNITVPKSVVKINYDSFINCSSIKSAGPIGGGYDYEFGWDTYIPENAFCYLTELESLKIPDTVTHIGGMLFGGGNKLKTAGPAGGGYDYEFGWTKTIPSYAFFGCTQLSTIVFPSNLVKIGDLAFASCHSLPSITIPSTVTEIGRGAFEDCFEITEINIENVSVINRALFAGCNSLTDVKLSKSLSSIGEYAFYDCRSLSSFEVPDTVTSIGEYAFADSGIEWIIIPVSVDSIGLMAWYGSALSDVYYQGFEEGWKAYGCAVPPYCEVHFAGAEHEHIPGVPNEENIKVDACEQGGTKDLVVRCKICLAEISRETVEIPAGTHIFGDWKYDYSNLIKSRVCTVCEYTETEEIDLNFDTRFVNEDNGVIIECNSDAFDDGVDLVTEHESYSDVENDDILETWYVALMKDGIEVQPRNPIKLKLKLPDGIREEIKVQLTLWHYHDGMWELMDTWYEDNYICCLTDSLSPFALASTEHETENEVLPTCEESGSYDDVYYLYVEEDEKTEIGRKTVTVPATGHKPSEAVKDNIVEATCTADGNYENVVYCSNCEQDLSREIVTVSALGHSFTNYVYNNDATAEEDGSETAKCDRCDATDTRIKPGTKLTPESPANPTANAKLNVKSSATVDYKSNVTVTVTANNVPEVYMLAIYEGNSLKAKGDNTRVSYKVGEMTSNRTFTVKVIDASENVQKDGSGNDLTANCEVKVKSGFFDKLIAFFKGLFGALPNVEIKP